MPVHHIPVEDLTDFVDELERTGAEQISFVVQHPVNLGLLLVVTRPPDRAQLETRGPA